MIRALAVLAGSSALIACGADKAGIGNSVDGGMASDAGPTCQTTLTFNPAMPYANPVATIRVVATTSASGVPSYTWRIFGPQGMVNSTPASMDGSQIDFVAPVAGPYDVSVNLGGGDPCTGSQSINVLAPGAQLIDYRLRVTPPASFAPPQDVIIQVHGGGDVTRAIGLDPGLAVVGNVSAGAGIPAYLRFMPVASPTAIVETFTQLNGSFSVNLLGQAHDVLIVPAVAGLAPRKVTWMPGTTSFTVNAGTAVSGVVRDASNAALAGAKVQITIDGVPSTLATTAADGSFTVRAMTVANANVEVDVTPPAGRGLPRLHAAAMFDLATSLQIAYTGLTCDLVNTPVKRGAANLPLANVTVVGTIASAASVVAGVTATATGEVRIPTTVDSAGKLPSVLVPRASLAAVVEIAAGDLAVAPVNVTACSAVSINAPAIVNASGTVQDTLLAPLAGVQLEATPIGDLALAGALPVQVRTSNAGGFSIGLASGGRYDVRFVDPSGRGAPFVALDLLAGSIPTNVTLPLALHITGDVSVPGNPNPVTGASVQILCLGCTGLAASRPIAQTATDSASHYRLAAPDPGTM